MKSFSIKARSCVLRNKKASQDVDSLLSGNIKFIIPVFQRSYSWDGRQVEKLLNDILYTFESEDGQLGAEPIFISTMQLGKPKENGEQEVIDGQQRLTTILLMIKVLSLLFPNCARLKEVGFDWIESRVSKGEQQKRLEEVLTISNVKSLLQKDEQRENVNRYLKNTQLICQILGTYFEEEGEGKSSALIEYLLQQVYFVVIETHAGLSKTLQIFDAINTTGLDLNGGDVFKIRMYEYLTSKKGEQKEVFDEISGLYQKIEAYNVKIGSSFMSMPHILGIYQFYLIGVYDLPKELYRYSYSRFSEEFFDTAFGLQKEGHFKDKTDRIELRLEDIESLIESRYDWEANWWSKAYYTEEDVCMSHMMWGSRYSTFWRIIVLYNLQLRKTDITEPERWARVLRFNSNLSRLYFAYSIVYARAVNHVRSKTYKLSLLISEGDLDETDRELSIMLNNVDLYNRVEKRLAGEITDNAKAKNMICRLSAMLEEDYKAEAVQDEHYRSKLERILYNPDQPIDIEHIQSYHHEDEAIRESIWEEWKGDINSIGNLTVLERSACSTRRAAMPV